jgi:hypothetical protein
MVNDCIQKSSPQVPVPNQMNQVHTLTIRFSMFLFWYPHLHLGISIGVFYSSFGNKSVYTVLVSPMRARCLASFTLLDLNILVILA